MLNRAAIIIRPREPYIVWARSVFADAMDPTEGGEETVYLVPDFEDEAGYERTLKKVWAEIFERELYGWCTDESMWP